MVPAFGRAVRGWERTHAFDDSRGREMKIKTRLLGIALCGLGVSACGGDGTDTSTVEGTVSTQASRVVGATVEVYGTQISTTTDRNGEFTLQNVPHGDVFFVIEANGNWGTVDYYYVPEETSGTVINLTVVPDGEIGDLAISLGRSLSESDGIVDVSFFPWEQGVPGAQGGETASISAASDPPFTFDLDGNAVPQAGLIADDEGFGELIYTSVKTGDGPITADVLGVGGVTVCDVAETPGITYPIVEKAITFVYAGCEPAP